MGWGWLGGVAGVVLAGIGGGCRPATPPVAGPIPVRTEAARDATERDGQRGTAYLATVKGRNQITLSFKVGGILERIGAGPSEGDWKEGTAVHRGQVLAQLQQTDFLVASNSAAAQAHLDQSQFERAERLLREGAVSQQEHDRAVAAKRASEALLALRRQDLWDSRILAPFDGRILTREVNAGETVAAGRPVLTIADLSEVEVEVGVPDRLVGWLKVGTPVRLGISSIGNEEFEGKVVEVGVAAREGSRLFRVLVRVENSGGRLRPGMSASVYLDEAATRVSGVLVPLSALVARGERELAVFVTTNGIARERRVETSDILDSSIVVTGGLQAGESVVVAGAGLLYDGASIASVRAADSKGSRGAR